MARAARRAQRAERTALADPRKPVYTDFDDEIGTMAEVTSPLETNIRAQGPDGVFPPNVMELQPVRRMDLLLSIR